MTRDRVTVERLETLLDQARQESIDAQTTNQELQNEIARFKQKISELQSKLYVCDINERIRIHSLGRR